MLSDIFLCTLLDVLLEQVVRPGLLGRAMLLRYADDVVLVFAREEAARRMWERTAAAFGPLWGDAAPREDPL